MKNSSKYISRRGFISRITSILAGAGGVKFLGSGASRPTGDRTSSGPVFVTGQRTHRYVPDGKVFAHKEIFECPELSPEYGISKITYDETPLPRRFAPEKYKNRDEIWTVTYQDTARIGTFAEQAEFERNQAESKKDGVSTQSFGDEDTYRGPLYVYKSPEGAEIENLAEASGPINVAWNTELGITAQRIRATMEVQHGWDTNIPELFRGFDSTDRYITITASEGQRVEKAQDADVAKTNGTSTAQRHVRLYNISISENNQHDVVGQAHIDPWDHSKIYKYTGGWTEKPDWQFNEAREKIVSVWDDMGCEAQKEVIENGDEFTSCDGRVAKILIDNVTAVAGSNPTDPDGDGRYEDINGNGRTDFSDIVTYSNNMDSGGPLAETAWAHDYNGNGRIDFDDVVRLFSDI